MLLSATRQVLGGYKITAAPVNAGTKKVLYFQTPGLRSQIPANPMKEPLTAAFIDGDPASIARGAPAVDFFNCGEFAPKIEPRQRLSGWYSGQLKRYRPAI